MRVLLATALLPFITAGSPAQAPRNSGPATTARSATQADSTPNIVSVPIHDGDPATVTGTLALHTRAGKQFLVIESPTPYHLVPPSGSLDAPPRIIRDISFNLAGQQAAIIPFVGRVITATGKLHIELRTKTSWNGALLESRIVILPGGKQLHEKH